MPKITISELKKQLSNLEPSVRESALQLLEKMGLDPIRANDRLTGTRVKGFSLEGKFYQAESHIDVLRQVLRLVFQKHTGEKDKILILKWKRSKHFSKNPGDLRMPEKIKGTDIFFETNENAKSLCIRCERILKLYGMDFTSFEIITD